MTVLEGVGLSCSFGGLRAVQDVSVQVRGGEVVALIGPNGAGKTTLFGCLTGTQPLDAGTVLLDGRDIGGLPPERRARLGIARTFQRLEVFSSMSVLDNLRAGVESRHPGALVRGLLGLPDRGQDDTTVQRVAEELDLVGVLREAAGTLSTGTQRRVELGRALCSSPSVLLLDEPASGLDSTETDELAVVLRRLAADGLAVLLVEHDVRLVLEIADRVYAMATGRLIAEGSAQEISEDPQVQAVYLARAET
jgi:branched-chain amino acid transport system ATP-binding protein